MSSNAVSPSSSVPVERVRRDSDKVWIEGVEGFHPGQFASSVHGVQARICQAVADGPSYEQLICYGGLAFRVEVHEAMCPSAGHPCCGYMCIENSNRAMPWKARVFDAFPGSKDEQGRAAFEREAVAAIRQSIDRGIPVHYGSEEDGLIIGYADEGRRWWCVHPYHEGGRETFWHDEILGFAGGNWPWGIAVWTQPKSDDERVSVRELTMAALRQAVDMWHTEKRDKYYVGEAAYAYWLKWLSDVDPGRIADPKAGMQGNGWCYDTLIHYRQHAAEWLKQTADDFDGDARQELLIAADHFEQIAAVCTKGLNSPWDLALRPDRFDEWTSAMRADQITRLTAARDHDRAAIAAIKKALTAGGADTFGE